MKTRYALLSSLLLGLAVAGPALAQCDVFLASMLPGNQAVLRANCPAAMIKEIRWYDGTVELASIALNPVVGCESAPCTPPVGDVYYTTPSLANGGHSFTAKATSSTSGTVNDIGSGAAATVIVTSVLPVAGVCGTTSGSCSTGTLNGSVTRPTASPWNDTWTCTGINNGSPTTCTALNTTAGSCGSMNGGTPQSSTPTTNLCSYGAPSNVVTATSAPFNFTWTCTGGGASSPQCSVPMASVNGACNFNGQTVATVPTAANACSAGTLNATPTNANNQLSWTCNGLVGGSNASCTAFLAATPVNGVCGTANGQTFSSAPTSNLCGQGNASAVSGTGPWSWTCSGANGGSPASCAANASPPPAGGCGTADKFWNPVSVQTLYPMPPVVTSGSGGYAVQFTPDIAAYPYGIVIGIADESANPLPKEAVVSTCARDFNPVGGNAACRSALSVLRLFYAPSTAQPTADDCVLQQGGTYYINVRPLDLTSRISFQFAATARVAPPVRGGR